MYRPLIKKTTIALGTLLVSATLVFAASVPGTVTARDGKGMATVRTSDGKDHQVKLGDAFTVGTKVECEAKNTVMECRQVQAAVTPAPSPATPAPAPAAPTPAPAPSAPTAPAPSTSTPAPASK